MRRNGNARKIINTLNQEGFYVECPCCGEKVLLKNYGLFFLDDFTPDAEELYKQHLLNINERKRELKERQKRMPRSSEVGAKAVNIGYILERLAPCLNEFRFDRNDCRSLFDPIDYLIFEGLNDKGKVSKISFVDIKTGGARLNNKQKEIKELVGNKKVELDTYSTDDEK